MTLIDRLKQYNAWRRGETDDLQPHPTQIGKDIDQAIAKLAAAERLAECIEYYIKACGGPEEVPESMNKARTAYQSQTKEQDER